MKLIKYRVKGTEFEVWASENRAAQIDAANNAAIVFSVYTTTDADDLAMVPAGWLERVEAAGQTTALNHHGGLYNAGDLVEVQVASDRAWHGKVVQCKVADEQDRARGVVGKWVYLVRVTSRLQEEPSAGSLVWVDELLMTLRR